MSSCIKSGCTNRKVRGSGQQFCAEHKLTKNGDSQSPLAQKAGKYGITVDDIIEMERNQGNRCAICGGEEPRFRHGKRMSLAVDHCHETGKVRGLLCSNCNRGLGFLGDTPDSIRKALEYLEENH